MLELNHLYNMDCMELMAEFPDKYFELAIVDPPYGIGATKFNNGSKKEWDSTAKKVRKNRLNSGGGKLKNRILNRSDCEWDKYPPNSEYFAELFRVSKNQIIWGGNYFELPPTRGIIVWDKVQPWENFSQVEMAWTSFDRPAALFRKGSRGGANSEEKIHPTQKPVALYEWLLTKYANEGDKILDTHVGSASSFIACHDLGFDFIGSEIDTYYYNEATKRMEEHFAQLRF